jgi:hypothetical protein
MLRAAVQGIIRLLAPQYVEGVATPRKGYRRLVLRGLRS